MYSNDLNRPRCGEIWMCNLPKENGSIQCGYRPVFILSNNKNNEYAPTINVIPLTSRMNKRNLPVHAELWDHQRYGLKVPSTMLIEQLTTIPSACLDKYIGTVDDPEILYRIYSAMSIQFPILSIATCASA